MSDELIDKFEIARLAGSRDGRTFAHNAQQRYADFPKPVKKGVGNKRTLWPKAEVLIWLKGYVPNDRSGGIQRKPKPPATHRDNALAIQFLAGKFDPERGGAS